MENFGEKYVPEKVVKNIAGNTSERNIKKEDLDEKVQFARSARDRFRLRNSRADMKKDSSGVVEKNESIDGVSKLIKEEQTDAKRRIEAIYIAVAEVLRERKGEKPTEIKEAELARYTRLVARGIKVYKNEEEKIVASLVYDNLQERASEGDQFLTRVAAYRKEKGFDEKISSEEKKALTNISYDTQVLKEVKPSDIEETSPESRTVVANRLAENGMTGELEQNIDKFSQLQTVVAEKFIENGKEKTVADNLNKFIDLNSEVALALLKAENGRSIAENLQRFKNLSQEVANKLLGINKVAEIAKNMDAFQPRDHKDISTDIIEKGGVREVIENFAKFSNIDREKNIPEYPKKTTFQELYDLYVFPGLKGAKLIDSLHGLETFSFKEQIKEIIKSQNDKAYSFFNRVKDIYGNKIREEDVIRIVDIARENPLKGEEALLREKAGFVG